MSNIVAEISEEMQEIFQGFTRAEDVSMNDVEERVSAAVRFVGTKIIRSDPV